MILSDEGGKEKIRGNIFGCFKAFRFMRKVVILIQENFFLFVAVKILFLKIIKMSKMKI
jgi:hypothetical protein